MNLNPAETKSSSHARTDRRSIRSLERTTRSVLAAATLDSLEPRRLFSADLTTTEWTTGHTSGCGCPFCCGVDAIATAALSVPTLAQTSVTKLSRGVGSTAAESFWKPVSKLPAAKATSKQYFTASAVAPFQISLSGLKAKLKKAPIEGSVAALENPLVLNIPSPDGTFDRFQVWESPIMEDGLAKQFPNIKTYAGVSLDDATQSIRFDLTPQGFHAQVLGGSGSYYVDPIFTTFSATSSTTFGSYWRSDAVATQDRLNWSCTVLSGEDLLPISDNDSGVVISNDNAGSQPPSLLRSAPTDTLSASDSVLSASGPTADTEFAIGGPQAITFGTQLRTFRLAVAASGEYTAAAGGGTVAGGQAAIVTAINRVTGVYENELSIRLVLVANNSSLVYTNSGSDPYSNTSNDINVNTGNINGVIGSANYDIGHVFTTGSGGVAGLGVVGKSTKGAGTTGLPNPTGDAFYIDYVAHEIGHQFNANHTFNSSQDSNRNASTAYEPGSGSTIMSYAGIVGGGEDLQNNSDPFFHSVSIDEIRRFVTNTNSGGVNISAVGSTTSTGNSVPTVSAGSSFTIPTGTPFTLTATGSDPDAGTTLTYDWQERALGVARTVSQADNGTSPITRVWSPTTSPSRTVPRLSNLLANTNAVGERLPTVARATWTWRVIARDNRPGGGGVSTSDVNLAVVNTGASFAVTAPNTNVSWATNSTQTVTWNVAGTTANGINTANVNILLSTNGGNTFTTVLASNTPNDGTQDITVPTGFTGSTARIRVEAVGNIFFDVSNTNFTIVNGGPAAPSAPTLAAASDTGTSSSDRITRFNNSSVGTALTVTVPGVTTGNTVQLFASSTAGGSVLVGTTVAASSSVTFTTNGSSTFANGNVNFTAQQISAAGTSNASGALAVTIDAAAPTLTSAGISPLNRTTALASTTLTFSESIVGFTASNLSLTRDTAPVSLTTATVTPSGATVAVTNLTSLTSTNGAYQLAISNAGVTDVAGNPLTTPTLVDFTVAIPPSTPSAPTLAAASDTGASSSDRITRRNNSSPTEALTFSVPGVASGNTVLLFAGSTLLGTAVATGSTVSITTDGSFTLGDGANTFSARQVSVGVTSAASGSTTVTIDTVAPSFNSYGIGTTIRNSAVSSTTLSFSEATAGFSLANLALTLDGLAAPLTGASLTPSGSNITLGGTAAVTSPTGVYMLSASNAGVTDLAGNPLPTIPATTFSVNVITLPENASENVVRVSPNNSIPGPVAIYVNSATVTYNWTFSSGQILRIDGSTGNDRVRYLTSASSSTADIRFNSRGGADSLDVESGDLQLNADLGPNVSVRAFSGTIVEFTTAQELAGLTIEDSSSVVANGPVTLDAVSIANDAAPLGARLYGGFLNLLTNPLIVHNGDTANLRDAVRAGRTTPGTGIGSSSLAVHNNLAVFPNFDPANPTVPFYSSFASLPLVASDVLIRFTYNGDLNADGIVNGADVRAFLEGFSTGQTGWANGDIDYDGVITPADFTLLNNALNANLPQI